MDNPGAPTNPTADLEKKFNDFAFAMKIGFFALLMGASYFNISAASYIPKFRIIFEDMMGGKELPWNTLAAIAAQNWLVGLACALPAVGLVALFAKSTNRAVATINICLLAAILEYSFIWWALAAPLVTIIKAMSNAQ